MAESPRSGDVIWCLVCPDEVPPAEMACVVIPTTGRRQQPYVGRVHKQCAERHRLTPAPAG
ncbi:hypothetical protein AB0C96_42855 [Streptomyces sp. NPDC048506]|uniref:hypothetical protein n=1 Tax=Streptomyces sp. NPDC048506 TaxID=3155028 RepID=UPI00344AC919